MKKSTRNLDNTAKIFSLDYIKNANVFRFSIVLKENVDKKILNVALNKSLEAYSSFKVRIRSGLFWDYFEFNVNDPIIEENSKDLKHFNYNKNNDYLFKISFHKKVINVDFFHVLTDGAGAIKFIKSIISNYLDIKNNTSYNDNEKKYLVSYQDEYIKNYVKKVGSGSSLKNVYLFPNKALRGINNTYHYTIDVDSLKRVSKENNVTITEYLAALYIYAIYLSMYNKKSKKEIAITIPVDIRKHYKVDTLSNFFVCMKINPKIYENNISNFESVLEAVRLEFKENLTEEKIKQYLSNEVGLGENKLYKYVPGFFKKLFMGNFGKYFGSSTTSTLSNVGIIDVDDRYKKYIDNVYTIVMPGRIQKIKCTICSFDKKLNITMNSNIEDIKFEREFYRLLKNNIKNVKVTSNRKISLIK